MCACTCKKKHWNKNVIKIIAVHFNHLIFRCYSNKQCNFTKRETEQKNTYFFFFFFYFLKQKHWSMWFHFQYKENSSTFRFCVKQLYFLLIIYICFSLWLCIQYFFFSITTKCTCTISHTIDFIYFSFFFSFLIAHILYNAHKQSTLFHTLGQGQKIQSSTFSYMDFLVFIQMINK